MPWHRVERTWQPETHEQDVQTTRIHIQKLDEVLREELARDGALTQVGDWLETDPHLAGLYMMCLAAEVGCR